MRALVLSDLWAPFPGGAERHVFNLSRALHRRGHDVEVVTGYGPALELDGPPVTSIADARPEQVGELLEAAVDNSGADVVIAHQYYATHHTDRIAGEGRPPLVQLVYNGQRVPEAAAAFYISDHIADQQRYRGPLDRVLRPTVDAADVVPDPDTAHRTAVGFVKPLPHKGPQMVYALARAMPAQRFLVLRGEWQPLEDVTGAPPNVEFMEPVVDVREFWSQVLVVLMPSTSEDAGTVPLEATANRVPCISSNVGGLVETNRGGILLSPTNVEAWEDHLRTMLTDPEEYRATVRRQVELQLPDALGDALDVIDQVAAR